MVFTCRAVFSEPFPSRGPVAQLIERIVRNDEVVGLIPIWSTTFTPPGAEPHLAWGALLVELGSVDVSFRIASGLGAALPEMGLLLYGGRRAQR